MTNVKTHYFITALFALFFLSSCNSTETPDPAPAPAETMVTDTAHTSKNAVDWQGRYVGVLPCGDCEGILTEIELKSDQTFQLKTSYLGTPEANEFIENGTFEWNKTGSEITLNGLEFETKQYKVGENRLWHLDQNGEIISGDLAEKYILNKK